MTYQIFGSCSNQTIYFQVTDTKKIEDKQVTTTINEACILQNEVCHHF
jgi:hypothetical protein